MEEVRQPRYSRTRSARASNDRQQEPSIPERSAGLVEALPIEQVERDEDRRRGQGARGAAQPLEARAELLVEGRQLAIEDERIEGQGGDRGHTSGKRLVCCTPVLLRSVTRWRSL